MVITFLVDNQNSWIMPFATRMLDELRGHGHEVHLVHDQKDIVPGDCAFFLGCEKLVGKDVRAKNTHNLVVHESALPRGKGWSPLTWQILEGKNDIPVTLFEAADDVDSGVIYMQEVIHFQGHELNDELKRQQGEATVRLVRAFVDVYPNIAGKSQHGQESFYPRRTPKDSELDPGKTIREQFPLLRVVDNERYPAFFRHAGKKYILKIYSVDE